MAGARDGIVGEAPHPTICQRLDCNNPGPLKLVEYATYKADLARDVEAGYRWYCDACVHGMYEQITFHGRLVAGPPLIIDGRLVASGSALAH